MILDTTKSVAKILLQVLYIILSIKLFNSSYNSNKKQMRKYNPLPLSEVCWDKGYSVNVVNKTFMSLIILKFASLLLRLMSYKVIPSRNFPDPVEHRPSLLCNSFSFIIIIIILNVAM